MGSRCIGGVAMTNQNIEYYRRRAEEELAAAEQASDTAIAQIHNEMARRYRVLSGGDELLNGNSGRAQPLGGTFAEPEPVPA